MRRTVLPVLAAIAACGDSAAGPVTPGESVAISGSYDAVVAGQNPVARLDGSLSMVLAQHGDSLSGEYRLHATLSATGQSANIVHTGHLVGAVVPPAGTTVRLRIDNAECPRYFMDFEGSYDDDSGTLTLIGAVDVINTVGGLCHLAVRFPSTLRLTRTPPS